MTASMSAAVETQSSELPRKANSKTSEHRRATKPIMEKKRRARINNSLNELKILILDALNKDPSRHSKLEKADILEMTVRHLQSIQRQNIASAISTDPSVLNKYRAGFAECATEVTRYIGRADGVEQTLKQRIVSHLNNCVTSLNAVPNIASNAYATGVARGAAFPGMLPPNGSPYTSNTPLHVQIPLQSATSLTGLFPANASTALSNARTTVGGDINNNNTSPLLTTPTLPIDAKPNLSTPPSSASSTSSSHFNFSLPLQQCSPPLRNAHLLYHNLNINVSQSNLSEVPSTASSAMLFRQSAINAWNRNCLESPIEQSSISPSGSSVGSGQLSPCESEDIDMESENMVPLMSHRNSSMSNDSVWRPW